MGMVASESSACGPAPAGMRRFEGNSIFTHGERPCGSGTGTVFSTRPYADARTTELLRSVR
jgi:hypothetical protein